MPRCLASALRHRKSTSTAKAHPKQKQTPFPCRSNDGSYAASAAAPAAASSAAAADDAAADASADAAAAASAVHSSLEYIEILPLQVII